MTSVTELLFPPEESVCACGGETEPSFPRLHHWFALAVPSHSGSHPLTWSSQNPHLCASRPVSHVVCTRDKSRGVPEATGSASPSSGTGESRLPALVIPDPPRGPALPVSYRFFCWEEKTSPPRPGLASDPQGQAGEHALLPFCHHLGGSRANGGAGLGPSFPSPHMLLWLLGALTRCHQNRGPWSLLTLPCLL